jgi:hypothetical protein
MKLNEIRFPFSSILGENATLQLLSVGNWMEYKDGQATDEVLGLSYNVGSASTFSRYTVKVPKVGASVSESQWKVAQAKNQPIFVTFENAMATPYRVDNNEYSLSIKADSIHAVTPKSV